jgi:alginate O-acetyltransferase complex protein AlgI
MSMTFNSWPFLLFFACFLPLAMALRRTGKARLCWQLLGSYYFYAWCNPFYLSIILYVTIMSWLLAWLMDKCPLDEEEKNPASEKFFSVSFRDFLLGRYGLGIGALLLLLSALTLAILGSGKTLPLALALGVVGLVFAVGIMRSKRITWLWGGIITILLPLLFFKYAHFIGSNIDSLLSWLGLSAALPNTASILFLNFDYLLPIGISFYTFQALGYLIDLYLQKIEREKDFLCLANFICFFPQLLAGPISRANELLPQIHAQTRIRLLNLTDGMSLFFIGLVKKKVLADWLAGYVNSVFDMPEQFSSAAILLAVFSYSWQIYFDFSAYSDMARGIARAIGYNLPINFNRPYLADGLGDFWRRWHISFSQWIMDYIFLPLNIRWRNYREKGISLALLVTFAVSGIWHGADWTFIVWGLLHGVGLAATYKLEKSARYRKKVPALIKKTWVFIFASFAWIFFRAESMDAALTILRRIALFSWEKPDFPIIALMAILLLWSYEAICETSLSWILKTRWVRIVLAIAMFLALAFASPGKESFVYFQF